MKVTYYYSSFGSSEKNGKVLFFSAGATNSGCRFCLPIRTAKRHRPCLLLAHHTTTAAGVFAITKNIWLALVDSLNPTQSSLPRTAVVSQQDTYIVASPVNFGTSCERSALVAKSDAIIHCIRISV